MARQLTPRQLASRIERELEAVANPERRERSQSYFGGALRPLGVAVPDIRRIARAHAKTLESPERVLAVAQALATGGTLEGRQAGHELLAARKDAAPLLDRATLQALGRGNDNWASVDSLATSLVGRAWLDGRLDDATLLDWAASDDRWWRRTALAATVCLNLASRGGSGDAPRTLAICRAALSREVDPMLGKALSWALRSVIPHAPDQVQRFVEEHEERLPAAAKREIRTKLETGRKNG